MEGKKKYFVLVLFLLLALMIFAFANPITDDGKEYGELKEVLQTGANDVYVVETIEGKEMLLPVIEECILDIDVDNKVVTAHIMPGLE